jgi:uncharacterized protein (DUF2062 family)
MLFKRRKNLSRWQHVAGWLWPRSGLSRAWKYIFHRIGRMPGTTHSIAAGLASGVAVSFTPFIGLHFLMGFALAWIVRGNLLASAIGTAIGNPWTFPFIFALTGQVGTVLLGYDVTASVPELSFEALWQEPLTYMASFLPIVFPLLVGAIPVAIIVWLLFYIGCRGLISGYRESRERRKKKRSQ